MPRSKLYNGKPMSHWEKMAKETVVDHLIRSAMRCDQRSLPGKIAYDRLMDLAKAEDPEVVKELLEEMKRCQRNLGRILNFMVKP